MTDYIEFSTRIKEKYPQYKDVDDLTLAQKMVEKYPQYKEQVTFEETSPSPQPSPQKGEGISRGIDLTPSGIPKMLAAGIVAPIQAVKDKSNLADAYNTVRNEINTNPIYKHPVQDFATDMLGYSALPMLRGGGIANFLGNAAIQGGVPGALETMKRGGNAAVGAGAGTGIAMALQGVVPPALKGGAKLVEKAVNSNFVKNNLPKVLEGLTSVPAEFSERAIEKELAGDSILNGKFDAKTAYIPIERKLREAKEMLPTNEDAAAEFYKLGKRASEGLENLKNQAGQNISEMLGNLSNEPIDVTGLKNAVNGVLKSYAKGGNVNPAEIRAGKDLQLVKDMLGIKGEEKTAKELTDYFNANRFNADEVGGNKLNKEAQEIAFNVLSQATGKDKRWLKSQLNANLPKMSTQNRQEFIQELLDQTDDKIENIDPSWRQYFPELTYENTQGGKGEIIARQMFDRIMGKNFAKPLDMLSPDELAINEAGKQYDRLLSDISANPEKSNLIKSSDKLDKILGNIPEEMQGDFATKYFKDVENIDNINNPKIKPIDLHNIKELLYDIANYDTAGGIRNDAIKGVANQINNYLRHIEPNYIKPNDTYSLIKGVEKELGGLNQYTIGNKIANIGEKGNVLSGLDQRLKDVDTLLPRGSKFFKNAQELKAEQDIVNQIKNTIGKQYERNPRLLANRTDEAFETALNDLQTRTNTNFMDDLQDIRAREALEKFFPGQGGGSGSSQGFGNLLRTSIIGGAPTAALLTHNPASLLGLLAVSPKFMAKGTIKNIGKLKNTADNILDGAYDAIIRRLAPLGAKGAANMLYGSVEYNNYR